MAIKIKFDSNNIARSPTFVLATRSGRKLGSIPAESISFSDDMKEHAEGFFSVHKDKVGSSLKIWNGIKDFKLLYCPEWDSWFQASVEIDESDELVKNVTITSLGKAELSQINLYDIEINSEDDIARDDYEPTVLYNSSNPKASLLHRILGKAPHYRIAHVDSSIADIQRTFSFNEKTLFDAFQEISDEINCLFRIDVRLGTNNKIDRSISVYDLESYCLNEKCHARSDFTTVCPKCGHDTYIHGYGEDTTILISTENLADNINYSTDVDAVKNCYKMIAGDDLMTATVINCNPNGSSYIWHISDDTKEDMSFELVERLNQYEAEYDYYKNEHIANIPSDIISAYNDLVDAYAQYSSKPINALPDKIIGYSALINAFYNSIDFQLLLESGLMPSPQLQNTTATLEAAKLTSNNIGDIAIANDNASDTAIGNAALSVVKTIVDSRYQVKVNSGAVAGNQWVGSFVLTNYSDEEDTAISEQVSLNISNDLETFLRQKIDKALSKQSDEATDIVALFKLELDKFQEELARYSLNRLISFNDSCQACLNILIEQGVADEETWGDLHERLYTPYYNKLSAIQEEMKKREADIKIITGVYDADNKLVSDGLQTVIDAERSFIQNKLDYESYLGEQLWLEFVSYRREDTYKNETFISDGLDNTELIENALAFIDEAEKEITKATTMQHSITATLKNLLVMKEFRPIVNYFEVGNWIRIKVDDKVYRLRLTKYKIDFANPEKLEVEFSDVTSISNSANDIKRVISKSAAIASTYKQVSQNAEKGKQSNEQVTDLISNGFSVSNIKIVGGSSGDNMTWNSNEMIFKDYDDVAEEYSDNQFKIVNSTLSITDNNWSSVKTALGNFYVPDSNGNLTRMYGINADVLIGRIILGEKLGIRNEDSSLKFDTSGLSIESSYDKTIRHKISFNPNDNSLMSIVRILDENEEDPIFSFDSDGTLLIKGNISVVKDNSIDTTKINGLHSVATSGEYTELNNIPALSTVALSGEYDDLLHKPSLHKIALSGSYNDLDDLPDLSMIEHNASMITLLMEHIKALNLKVFGNEEGNVSTDTSTEV